MIQLLWMHDSENVPGFVFFVLQTVLSRTTFAFHRKGKERCCYCEAHLRIWCNYYWWTFVPRKVLIHVILLNSTFLLKMHSFQINETLPNCMMQLKSNHKKPGHCILWVKLFSRLHTGFIVEASQKNIEIKINSTKPGHAIL